MSLRDADSQALSLASGHARLRLAALYTLQHGLAAKREDLEWRRGIGA